MMRKIIVLFLSFYSITLSVCFAQKNKNPEDSYKWAAGIGSGFLYISGDVPAIKTQVQQSIYLYRPFAKWFALRLAYTHGNAKGIQWQAAQNFAKNTAWAASYAAPVRTQGNSIAYGYTSNGVFTPAANGDLVYYNYKTAINTIGLSAQFTLPLPFDKPRAGIHFLLGAGALFYKAKVNTKGSNGTYASLFNQLGSGISQGKKEILKTLKNSMDDSYETNAEALNKAQPLTQHIGLGFSYKFKQRLEAGLERIFTFTKTDLTDGQRWQEQPFGDAVLTRDFDWLIQNSIYLKYQF